MAESTPDSPDETSTNTETEAVEAADDASVDNTDTDAAAETASEAAEEPNTETETNPETEANEEASSNGSDDSSPSSSSAGGNSGGGTPQAFSAIIEADALAQTIDTLTVLVEESRIHLNDLGLRLSAVDPANVAMDETNISETAFESYQANGGVLGVNLDKLADVVSMAGKGDLVQLELDPETRKLHIQIDGLEYTLALIDPDSIRAEPDIPDLDLPARIVLEGADLDRAIRAADMVSDHVALAVDVNDEVFRVHAEGDTDDVDLELGRDDLIDLEVGDANSLFSLDYLKDLNKAIPKDAEVELLLGEGFPVKISFEYADGAASVTQMLAPRIQSD